METLDKCFENVCELDLIFHVDKVTGCLVFVLLFLPFNLICDLISFFFKVEFCFLARSHWHVFVA